MFSICTAFVENGKLEETIKQYADSERKFTKDIGVLFRKFFQCQIQPHIIWSITEWESEKAHHDAAQSIMEIRRDDRFAAIAFGPEPYFEIFCNEEESLNSGKFSEKLQIVIVIHGLISEKVKDKYLEIRKERIREHREQCHWLRVFYNTYNSNEFVSFL